MKKATCSFYLSEDQKKAIEKQAQKTGQNQSEVLSEWIAFRLGFNDSFFEQIEKVAKLLQFPIQIVIQNMLIRRIACDYAHLKTFGQSPNGLMEFRIRNGELMTGDDLVEELTNQYLDLFQRFKESIEKDQEDVPEQLEQWENALQTWIC